MWSEKGCGCFRQPAWNALPVSLYEWINPKEVLIVKRIAAFFLVLVLCLAFSVALAQRVDCEQGGFSVTLPDHFVEEPVASSGDPELCFYWHGEKLTVLGYAAYLGEFASSELFEVLTGNETDYGWKTVNGMSMYYTRSEEYGSVTITYRWMDRGNNVTLSFTYSADDSSVLSTVNRIISSISFDAGH